jgi:2-polyprenyl-3-methyl-5-hydroxy-6-metoxy-1,4-benzoquinol methylase
MKYPQCIDELQYDVVSTMQLTKAVMKCVVCGDTQIAGLARWHATCRSCHYESAALTPAINAPSTVAMDEAQREAALKALRVENFNTIVAYAREHVSARNPRLLDVGSAHGWFLEAARSQFDVLGVEPDAEVGGRAAERGLPVRSGYFPDVVDPEERFDAIVFNDVLEHIPNINSALCACHAHLNGGGILILNLPNSRGFFYRLSKVLARIGWPGPFERMWQKDMPSPHVHYFDPSNLQELVSKQGFTMAKTAELPALRAKGLMERLRYVGNASTVSLYLQYVVIRCAIPVLSVFPSDIIVSIFRKETLN